MKSDVRLYVLTCISNPNGYQSRLHLYREFEEYISKEKNAILYTAEMIYEGQEYSVTEKDNIHHLQLVGDDVVWSKENLLNLLRKQLPEDAKYIAWIDADVVFSRSDWVKATINALQEKDVVQMFSECRDLYPDYTTIPNSVFRGIIHQAINNPLFSMEDGYGKKRTGHTGYAWACTADAWDKTDGLIDFSVMGSGDYQMSCALLGNVVASTYDKSYSEGYVDALQQWQDKASGLSVGYVDGLCLHNYHGKKSDRGYGTRWKVLVDLEFSPQRDLIVGDNGVITLNKDSEKYSELKENLISYFSSRKEDSHLEG